jgi:hypothetical protein
MAKRPFFHTRSVVSESKAEMSLVKACGRGVAGYGRAEQSSWRAPFFFIQAADTQLGMMDYWGSNGKVLYFPRCNQTVKLSTPTPSFFDPFSLRPFIYM